MSPPRYRPQGFRDPADPLDAGRSPIPGYGWRRGGADESRELHCPNGCVLDVAGMIEGVVECAAHTARNGKGCGAWMYVVAVEDWQTVWWEITHEEGREIKARALRGSRVTAYLRLSGRHNRKGAA